MISFTIQFKPKIINFKEKKKPDLQSNGFQKNMVTKWAPLLVLQTIDKDEKVNKKNVCDDRTYSL